MLRWSLTKRSDFKEKEEILRASSRQTAKILLGEAAALVKTEGVGERIYDAQERNVRQKLYVQSK